MSDSPLAGPEPSDLSPMSDAVANDLTPTPEEIAEVERERNGLREFVEGLGFADIKSGQWFPRLLTIVDDELREEGRRGVLPGQVPQGPSGRYCRQ